jgi:hypothetical protein
MEIVGCAATKKKDLLQATKARVGARAVFEDVVTHVTQKLVAQAAPRVPDPAPPAQDTHAAPL